MRFAFLMYTAVLLVRSVAFADNTQPELNSLRHKVLQAINSSKTTDSLYISLDKVTDKQPVIVGYLGILDALKAKHTWNPYFKLKYLDIAEKEMAQAITADPHNIEIRYMRFSVEHNVPGFLGYGKDLTSDREEIIGQLAHKNFGTADKELTVSIIRFLIDSKRCTPAENEALHKQLAAIN